jgi:hypothetical protein
MRAHVASLRVVVVATLAICQSRPYPKMFRMQVKSTVRLILLECHLDGAFALLRFLVTKNSLKRENMANGR